MRSSGESMVTEGEPLERLSEHPLRSITLRIQEETYQKLIAIAGEKSKSEYIRELLVEHLKEPQEELNSASREAQGVLEAKIDSLEAIIKAKDQTIKILEEDKGFVILEYTEAKAKLNRLLMPSQEEITKKAWYQFWKK
jgi:predicted CopG family antitoxin